MKSLTIAGSHDALSSAAIWLREHSQIPPEKPIFDEFEDQFRCRLVVQNRLDPWYTPDWAIFDTEEDLSLFLLRWS